MRVKEPPFTKMLNLAAEKLGARALACSDDFFASMHNLIQPGRGIFIEDKYTENGKWMDGWESRRKRDPGHDWCIIKLGAQGIIHGLDVDTNHFMGNHPPQCSLDACYSRHDDTTEMSWEEILPRTELNPGSQHLIGIDNTKKYTHVRLHIYPDGGVARLKVYGEVQKDWSGISGDDILDLGCAVNGAKSIACNDMFFSHMDNLIMPGPGINMGDGWETKRNRTPNNRDFVIIRLAHIGIIKKLIVDTSHFKGNYPDSCSIDACLSYDDNIDRMAWQPILGQTKLNADNEHIFKEEISEHSPVSHIRLSIYPDGGISRLRLFGSIVKS